MLDFNEWRLNEATSDVVSKYNFTYKSHLNKVSKLSLTHYTQRVGANLDGHATTGGHDGVSQQEQMAMGTIFEPAVDYVKLKRLIVKDGTTEVDVLDFLKKNTVRSSDWKLVK